MQIEAGGVSLGAAKVLRKQAEANALALSRRLAFLKQEEARLAKKVLETRQRTQAVSASQSNTARSRLAKQHRSTVAAVERTAQAEHLEMLKSDHRNALLNSLHTVKTRRWSQADVLRKNRSQCEQRIRKATLNALVENQHISQRVKSQHSEAKMRRASAESERKSQIQAELQGKVKVEIERKAGVEREIKALEAEEVELIGRLQRTTMREKNAVAELREALGSGMDATMVIEEMQLI